MQSHPNEVPSTPGGPQSASTSAKAVNPSAAVPITGAPRKLDEAKKDQICLLVARGHSLMAAADIVGVSDRTIRRERRRDPFFKQRLAEKGEDIADVCFESLRAAAPEKPHAANQLYKLVYPDRYYYRPDTITRHEHDAWTTEVFALFESIATPEQMRELHRKLSGRHKRCK